MSHPNSTSNARNRPSARLKAAASQPRKSNLGQSSIVGIWRIGETIHSGNCGDVSTCQPADAAGSPRFDYVIKQANDSTMPSRSQIASHVAAASQSTHPNLVPVLDASTDCTRPYLVMPKIEGHTMQWYMTKPLPCNLPVALWFVRQAAQGLDAMHQAGWIHGDVKPANIMVGSQGHVTLIDLGFATRIHTVSSNQFRGTVDYASPESISRQFAAMPTMDVFSLGRVLWQWLTCIRPVEASYLEPVADLVEKMICDTPADRPSASEIVKTLLKLEIETLGKHIGPDESANEIRRAA